MTPIALTNPVVMGYAQIAIAIAFNLITAYMLKKADGFTVFWPSLIALVTICITQVFVSRALATGINMGLAIAIVVVVVMIGSVIMGAVFFDEAVPTQKLAGFSLAVIGVVIASVAK